MSHPCDDNSRRNQRPANESAEWFADFIARCGTMTDYREVEIQLKEMIARHLHDVDTVIVNVNVRAVVAPVSIEQVTVFVSHATSGDAPRDERVIVDVGSESEKHTRMQLLIRRLSELGFDCEAYHPEPHAEWYTLDSGAALGAVVLWNRRRPVASHAVRRLKALQPYVRWCMLFVSALHQARRPMDQRFYEAMDAMTIAGGLTEREMEVALYRMNGLQNKEIARKLGVSVNTVETHMKRVYDKTGVNGIMKLYQKFFAPQLTEATQKSIHQTGDASTHLGR